MRSGQWLGLVTIGLVLFFDTDVWVNGRTFGPPDPTPLIHQGALPEHMEERRRTRCEDIHPIHLAERPLDESK